MRRITTMLLLARLIIDYQGFFFLSFLLQCYTCRSFVHAKIEEFRDIMSLILVRSGSHTLNIWTVIYEEFRDKMCFCA